MKLFTCRWAGQALRVLLLAFVVTSVPTASANIISFLSEGWVLGEVKREITGTGAGRILWRQGSSDIAMLGKAHAQVDDPSSGMFDLKITLNRQFELTERGEVHLPTYVYGNLLFSMLDPPPGKQTGFLSIDAHAKVMEVNVGGEGEPPQDLPLYIYDAKRTPGTEGGPVHKFEKFFMPSETLRAGIYEVQLQLNVTGNANPANDPEGVGSQVEADFSFIKSLDPNGPPGPRHSYQDDSRHGLFGSVFAVPEGLGNSREAVRAPEARGVHNVDGSGVTVAVLEPGIGYEHASFLTPPPLENSFFENRYVTNLFGPFGSNQDAEKRRSEHALAVAGIIASAHADTGSAGIAPAARILHADFFSFAGDTPADRYNAALNAIHKEGVNIVNMSFGVPHEPPPKSGYTQELWNDIRASVNQAVDKFVNDKGTTLVQAAGNIPSDVGTPANAYNIISVGSLNRDFSRRAELSSFEHDTPSVPTLVAPGEYINAPWAVDTDGNGNLDNFGRGFLGEGYHREMVATGAIIGTSFAAPHVSGTVALMQQLADREKVDIAPHFDHRVAKAILVHSATREGITHFNGTTGWSQEFSGGGMGQPVPHPSPLKVTRSLDTQLGGGLLNTRAALDVLAAGLVITEEASDSTVEHRKLQASDFNERPFFGTTWDKGWISGAGEDGPGIVDYLLGDIRGRITATLTWDRYVDDSGGGVLPNLELQIFFISRELHWLAAETDKVGENVKLIDWKIPDVRQGGGPSSHSICELGTTPS